MSFRPSVRLLQRGPQWTDFREIRCCELVRKSVEKIQILVYVRQNVGRFTWILNARCILLPAIYVAQQYREPIVALPCQQWLCKPATVLRDIYVVYLVSISHSYIF